MAKASAGRFSGSSCVLQSAILFLLVRPCSMERHLTRAGAVALSFANIFSFLPIKREIMTPEMIAGLSNLAQIVGVAQSLLGGILLFLLGLALRNRFRMR